MEDRMEIAEKWNGKNKIVIGRIQVDNKDGEVLMKKVEHFVAIKAKIVSIKK